VAGLLYAGYLLTWGLNQQRVPFPEVAGYETSPPTEEELTALAEELIARINVLRPQLAEDAAGVSVQPHPPGELLRRVRRAFDGVAEVHPSLKAPPSTPKRPLLSPLMSAWWIAGIYSPFTAEAHVNRQLPAPQIAFTTAHELAHGLGFARENEANYVAWLACSRSEDPVLRYSALLQASRRVLGAIAAHDEQRARALVETLEPGVRRDQEAIVRFWTAAESLTTRLAQNVNDAYLKSQGQVHGIRTYGMFIDLLAAERRREFDAGGPTSYHPVRESPEPQQKEP